MNLSRTISLYIGRQFVFWVAVIFLTLLGLVLLIDTVELLRRSELIEALNQIQALNP